jgi:hypothetical protein
MRRKEIGTVRRDERADLEDDLVAVSEDERARIDSQPYAVHVKAHAAAEAEEPARRELSPPHAEELAQPRRPLEVDDAGRLDGPEPRPAARRANPDARRNDDHAVVGEELEMHSGSRSPEGTRTRSVHRRLGVVLRSHTDRRRHEGKHLLHGIALLAALGLLAGCGGGGNSSGPTISIQPAGQYRLEFKTLGAAEAGKPTKISMAIIQPNGKPLTKFKRGSGPHTGVHLIMVRRDLGDIVHRHPPIAADGHMSDTVVFPAAGPYRVVVDVYPQQTTPQPNFQLFSSLRVQGPYKPQPLPAFSPTQTVDGVTFTLHGKPNLRAIQASLLDFTVTANGKPATFTPWYGALAHAIFFRAGSLDYFHTHVCAPGASGCTSVFGSAKVTGTSATPGQLHVGVLVPVAGTWRLFLQCQVDGHILTAPFTLKVR